MLQPKLRIVHPNAKNTGSQIEFLVRPASDLETGGLMVSFTSQKTVGDFSNGKRVMATFDYENKITVKLSALEVSQMVAVFDGYTESIDDGKGLFHKSMKGTAVIGLTHKVEPTPGYWLSVKRKPTEGDEKKVGIFITPNEAYMLSIMLKQGIFYMGFGVPEKWPDAKEVKQETPENKSV